MGARTAMSGRGAGRRADAPLALGFTVFVVVGLAILCLSWHIIAATGIESGDFAANSILIQSAKHLRLTLGNYSRVGFNHPGPAILYVLAAGEALFHDALGWVTPIGGQIIAADLYNAAWLGLAVTLIRRMNVGTGRVLVIAAVTIAVMAMRDPRDFDNLWFPYLYAMPFLAFVVALMGVACGDSLAWVALALCTGVLVNGHVSFVGVCGIAIAVVVTDSLVAGRRWRLVPMAWAAATFGLFLLPLAIREARHSPGPIEEYARVAGQNAAHGLLESVRFVGHHVAVTALEFVVVALALVAVAARWREPFYRAVLASIVGVSLGALYYVVKGVDDLQYDYVLIYFGAVPAIVLGVAAYDVLARSRSGAVPAVIALALAIWAVPLYNDAPMPDYDQPIIAEVDRDLTAVAPQRVALWLANNHDWGKVWSTMLGVEAARIRDGRALGFCIATNWHVSFADVARCDPSDADAPQLIVDAAETAHSDDATLLATSGGLDFLSLQRACLHPGAEWTVSDRPIAMTGAAATGWSVLENTFVWSLDKRSTLDLCLDEGVKTIGIDLHAFLPTPASRQHVIAEVKGGASVEADFDAAHSAQVITIPVPEGHPEEMHVTFDLPDAISPAQAGLSDDGRVLAVALYGVRAE